jgi:hypothetical protein
MARRPGNFDQQAQVPVSRQTEDRHLKRLATCIHMILLAAAAVAPSVGIKLSASFGFGSAAACSSAGDKSFSVASVIGALLTARQQLSLGRGAIYAMGSAVMHLKCLQQDISGSQMGQIAPNCSNQEGQGNRHVV